MSNVRPQEMRRSFLSALALAGLSATGPTESKTPRKVDKRLVGTWKSDKERTVARWQYNKQVDSAQRERFESIFGKLLWRITETHYYGTFEDQKFSGTYTVLASDERSVCVSHHNDGKPELKQYFFEEGYMYVLSGYNVEFLKRVEA
jgi:hypothetical protein